MKHLKADEVQYTTRPLTVFEHCLEMQIQSTSNRSPEFFQLWSMLLWSRQNEVLPKNLFADILMTDWQDHIESCVAAMHVGKEINEVIDNLNSAWRFNFREKSWDRSKLDEWAKTNS